MSGMQGASCSLKARDSLRSRMGWRFASRVWTTRSCAGKRQRIRERVERLWWSCNTCNSSSNSSTSDRSQLSSNSTALFAHRLAAVITSRAVTPTGTCTPIPAMSRSCSFAAPRNHSLSTLWPSRRSARKRATRKYPSAPAEAPQSSIIISRVSSDAYMYHATSCGSSSRGAGKARGECRVSMSLWMFSSGATRSWSARICRHPSWPFQAAACSTVQL
mmetsp:Transcript_40873/g.89039  ORF Transcript_40873/g.89039 Transcript_40873/m.89039 type:complete len:218 (-) Transcript_40873:286-939(-)